jgi:hypothetical protein
VVAIKKESFVNLLKMQCLLAAAVLISVVLGGCASTQPIPELSDPKSSGLAIDVSLKTPLGMFGIMFEPEQIYFAKIDGEGGLLQQKIIRSNYIKDGRAYLLNVRPGIYVAVAEFHQLTPRHQETEAPLRYTTYFSKELVEQTRVTVREGDFVFIGSYVVNVSGGFNGADEVQTHYKNVIAPNANTSGFGYFIGGDYQYCGTLLERKIDEQTHNEFVRKAKEDLAGSGWQTRIR